MKKIQIITILLILALSSLSSTVLALQNSNESFNMLDVSEALALQNSNESFNILDVSEALALQNSNESFNMLDVSEALALEQRHVPASKVHEFYGVAPYWEGQEREKSLGMEEYEPHEGY